MNAPAPSPTNTPGPGFAPYFGFASLGSRSRGNGSVEATSDRRSYRPTRLFFFGNEAPKLAVVIAELSAANDQQISLDEVVGALP